MLLLKIIILALGITFSVFGYHIVFKKKFGLINVILKLSIGVKRMQMRFMCWQEFVNLRCWITCTICVINDIYVEKYRRKRVWQ